MMSTPYEGTSYDYLREGKPFDIKHTTSCMGIVTEVFQRYRKVLRRLNPVHPVLAYGPKAEWIIAGHDETTYSRGTGTPFEKVLELDAKVRFLTLDSNR